MNTKREMADFSTSEFFGAWPISVKIFFHRNDQGKQVFSVERDGKEVLANTIFPIAVSHAAAIVREHLEGYPS